EARQSHPAADERQSRLVRQPSDSRHQRPDRQHQDSEQAKAVGANGRYGVGRMGHERAATLPLADRSVKLLARKRPARMALAVRIARTLRMPWPGLEPGRLAPLPPQDSVSTNFTTRAGGET